MRCFGRLRAPFVSGVLAAVIALGLAGCGRRGALEPAPDPSVATAQPTDGDSLRPVERRTRRVPITPPHEPFVLDPLL